MTTLRVERVSKRYAGAKPTITDVDLDLSSGEFLALLGPSGCGKTTLVKMIAGFETPDAGDILVDGASILAQPPDRRGIAMVFQNLLLFPNMTVAQNIGFGLKMRGNSPDRIAVKVDEVLDMLQLTGLADRKPSALSGGQQQRVALARALAIEPKLLLLDEPMSGLDPHLRDDLGQIIRELQKRTAVTTLMITHDQKEATLLADRIALLLAGSIAQVSPPKDLFQKPSSMEVAKFLGRRNFALGHASRGVFTASFGQFTLPKGCPTGQGHLILPTEAIRIGHAKENGFRAQLDRLRFAGANMRLSLSTHDLSIEAALPVGQCRHLIEGTNIDLHIERDDLWVVP